MKNWFRKLYRKYPTHAANSEPHPALAHLQITIQPNEYLGILQDWHQKSRSPKDYMEKIPIYVISRCPFCDTEYKTRLDTHSLRSCYTVAPNSGDWLGVKISGRCVHFLAVHPFVNLNGLFPDEVNRFYNVYGEVSRFRNDYDVPFISPLFLPDEVPSYAVMHSLPVCRIEDKRFVPRYYLYTLTYYVPENYISWITPPGGKQEFRDGIIAERRGLEIKANQLHWEEFLYFPSQARRHPDWWDLPLWVKKGKLLWLDPYSPNLELKKGPVEDFPYANIQGYRRGIEIRNGKFRFTD